MSYYVAPLNRPYDFRVLLEVYIYTQRKNFVHPDFATYYSGLLEVLENIFGVRLSSEGLSHNQRIFWSLFQNTVKSLLQITNPWAGYLEAGLLVRKIEEIGKPGQVVERASAVIREANKASEIAHREMLEALFCAIFGEHSQVVTSKELLQAGFDDSREPDIADYSHDW